MIEYLRVAPGNRVYQQTASDTWRAYYVNHVEYTPERRATQHEGQRPACISVELVYEELGKERMTTLDLDNKSVDRMTVAQALAAQGYVTETPDLRAAYLEATARFAHVFDRVGTQYTAEGRGQNLDNRWGDSSHGMPMAHEGERARVVVDVVHEDGENQGHREIGRLRPNFWRQKKPQATEFIDTDDLGGNRLIERFGTTDVPDQSPKIPIHPLIPVYDLGRHQRVKIDVRHLEEYAFDKTMGERLILPSITKRLVDALVSQGRVSFKDIIEGKGSGATVILGGAPGVGKTLTAEVFAEATERPLLSVQAAQLGTSPDNVESNLRDILKRGNRWNAVVLLDEADVYVHERGIDLQQNAIVAAFLRVLEYHTATIFLTTNRLDSVDDAILSRCIARVDYTLPTGEQQRLIWGVLSDLNATGLTNEDLDIIVAKHQGLSGRDIKQLLKLASLWAESREEAIGWQTIDFVRQFLPTRAL